MASDFFLKLDGIDGDSSDKNHGKWIELLAFSHGAEQNVSLARGTDITGRGQFLPFTFTHTLDKATPKLQQFCMNGQKIAKAELHFCRAIGGAQVPVYEVKLENVKIASAKIETVKPTGENTHEQPVEVVSLIAGKMTWKFTPIKPDNTKDGAIEANFDQVSNS